MLFKILLQNIKFTLYFLLKKGLKKYRFFFFFLQLYAFYIIRNTIRINNDELYFTMMNSKRIIRFTKRLLHLILNFHFLVIEIERSTALSGAEVKYNIGIFKNHFKKDLRDDEFKISSSRSALNVKRRKNE